MVEINLGLLTKGLYSIEINANAYIHFTVNVKRNQWKEDYSLNTKHYIRIFYNQQVY